MTTRIRFADSEMAAVAVRYHAGVSIQRLFRERDRDWRVLRRALTEAGVVLRTRRRVPSERVGWVITRYQAGASRRELAGHTGCSYSRIRRLLVHFKLPVIAVLSR